jgi:hypothetical protein
MRKIAQASGILEFFKDTAMKDPAGCEYVDAEFLEELESDYSFISAALEAGGVAATYQMSRNELPQFLTLTS